ncbi:MAG: DivIVA domain-containing protein, partial [bacterium]|nr:DivIVA domain-containing protein [bacterium]
MRLTPLDIRKQEFKKAMRGLEADEVHAFLATVADEYEAVLNDNKALRERLIELDDKVAEYRNMEKTLRDTLLTAERVTVEAKDNARREANLIVKEAQIEAEKSVRDIKQEAMNIRHEIQNLKRQRDSYLMRMKMLVESHLKFLETAETDFVSEEKQLEGEIKKWADTGKATAQKQTSATKPVDPASASAHAPGPAQPAASSTPPVRPPDPPASTPSERREIPPSTASAPANTERPSAPAPPRAGGGLDQARSV